MTQSEQLNEISERIHAPATTPIDLVSDQSESEEVSTHFYTNKASQHNLI